MMAQRRPKIDLGQQTGLKEESRLDRKRERWAARNKDKNPDENPFLAAIKPINHNYGDTAESIQDLETRLKNLEFGNFPGYFNYRKNATPQDTDMDTAQADSDDDRLGLMKQEWFERKDVLDIGCNRGHITYAVAKEFSPKFILGIDIDIKMINMANRDLHLHLEKGLMSRCDKLRLDHARALKTGEEYSECLNHFPLSSYVASGPTHNDDELSSFPNNLLFIEHNYVLSRDELVEKQKPYFDTILCLSVTKWIHLNYGDAGLMRFFRRIYNHLRPDGLLILEVQTFDNYGRRKKLSDRLRANYQSIKFKPDQFDDYLLSSEVGFREILCSTTTDHRCSGFKRPLKVFLK